MNFILLCYSSLYNYYCCIILPLVQLYYHENCSFHCNYYSLIILNPYCNAFLIFYQWNYCCTYQLQCIILSKLFEIVTMLIKSTCWSLVHRGLTILKGPAGRLCCTFINILGYYLCNNNCINYKNNILVIQVESSFPSGNVIIQYNLTVLGRIQLSPCSVISRVFSLEI